MLKTNVYDMNGKQVGEVELSEAVFGIEPNESVVHSSSRIIWPTAVRARSPH